MKRKKVGLALSSGGSGGPAHVGALDILKKNDIPIDMISGTSIGAVVGAFYAAGKSIDEITDTMTDLSLTKLLSVTDFAIPTSGLIKGQRIQRWVKSIIGDISFSDLNIPFACLATDIVTGEAVVLNEGPIAPALRASVSIPVIFTPAKLNGRFLVDGMLVEPVPVRVLREMGADIIIAVNVLPYMGGQTGKASNWGRDKRKKPNIFSVITRMMYIVGYQSVQTNVREADVVITPEVGHIFPGYFSRADDCLLQGKEAARLAIPEIKRALEI